jgi:hypothetical protein
MSWHRNWETIKDISAVEVSGGWDLYLGADCHLGQAQVEREVFDFAAAVERNCGVVRRHAPGPRR